jgi:hypothetical protein
LTTGRSGWLPEAPPEEEMFVRKVQVIPPEPTG